MMAAVIALGLAPGVASAAPTVASADSIDLTGQLSAGGTLAISQTITFADDATTGGTLTQSFPRYAELLGQRYTYDVTNITLTTKDGPVAEPSLKRTPAATILSFPSGLGPYTVTYNVSGATTQTVDGKVSFRWLVLQGLNFDVAKVSGSISAPAGAINFDCLSGVAGALRTCASYGGGLHGATGLSFTDTNRLAGDVIQAEIVFPVGPVALTEQVRPVWSLGRALTPGATQLGLAIGLLVVGALVGWGIWRRARAGYRAQATPPAWFTPDANGGVHFVTDPQSRPGLVGTLVDSSADPADILGTILDLAQRGHVRITQLDPASAFGLPDWVFERLAGGDELKGYEQGLLDALTYSEVRVSDLSAAVAGSIGGVQQALYQEAWSAGWFARVPGKRSRSVGLAWVGIGLSLVATAALLMFTTYGLIGLALVGVALGALTLAYQLPAISPRGQAVMAGLAGLGDALHTQDLTALDPDHRLDTIARVLPYAVVLGSWDRWLAGLAPAGSDDPADVLAWYQAPGGWQARDLPASLEAFITVVTGRLFTRA